MPHSNEGRQPCVTAPGAEGGAPLLSLGGGGGGGGGEGGGEWGGGGGGGGMAHGRWAQRTAARAFAPERV